MELDKVFKEKVRDLLDQVIAEEISKKSSDFLQNKIENSLNQKFQDLIDNKFKDFITNQMFAIYGSPEWIKNTIKESKQFNDFTSRILKNNSNSIDKLKDSLEDNKEALFSLTSEIERNRNLQEATNNVIKYFANALNNLNDIISTCNEGKKIREKKIKRKKQ